ncbi:MAG: pantetheine-phosphate adenylyltransferase [Candidatus Eisenbacteria bacterium]
MTTPRTALFPGTFDPFTNGHLDLTRRAARLFDRVVVAVADSTSKGTLFSMHERAEMIRQSVAGLRRVSVVTFGDLVVECARREGAMVLIRGLRAVSDFEFEFQMALMNRRLSRSLEVAFLMPSQQYTYLNSTLVREIARLGGSITGLVPGLVERQLRAKLRARAAAPAAPRSASRPGAASVPAVSAPAPRRRRRGGAPRVRRGAK